MVKHTGTLAASVTFEGAGGQIQLKICDEGAGTNGQGGILNFQHRLSLVGCQMQILSSSSKGTPVMFEIPKQEVK